MTAAERRDAIIESLSIHRRLKIECLMQRFGVCRRTINKDIVALSESYPIYTITGSSGGVFVMEGFKYRKAQLSEKQIALLNKLLPTLSEEDRETMSGIIRLCKGGKDETQCI